jgi:large subunit ribosomal protein L18
MAKLNRTDARLRRHRRVRKNIKGTADIPRLNIYRSLADTYAQVIDDQNGHTLVSASSIDNDLGKKIKGMKKTEQAKEVGKLIGKRAMEKGIKKVVFDRGGYKYFGRVKALADAAREAGLEF